MTQFCKMGIGFQSLGLTYLVFDLRRGFCGRPSTEHKKANVSKNDLIRFLVMNCQAVIESYTFGFSVLIGTSLR